LALEAEGKENPTKPDELSDPTEEGENDGNEEEEE